MWALETREDRPGARWQLQATFTLRREARAACLGWDTTFETRVRKTRN